MHKYAHFAMLTTNELRKVLNEKGKRPIEREQIMAEVAAYKAAQRNNKIRKAKHDSLWRELIEPLSNEQRTVYNMGRYAKQGYPNPERTKAIAAYSEVLSKLNRKLRGYWATYQKTPAQLALDKKIPNKGEHWIDWVPDKIKLAVAELFDAIPHNFKAKSKIPFERKIPKNMVAKRKTSLLRTIKVETGKAEREIAMLTDLLKGETNEDLDHAKEELKRLKTALDIVLKAPDDELLPYTWQSLLKD